MADERAKLKRIQQGYKAVQERFTPPPGETLADPQESLRRLQQSQKTPEQYAQEQLGYDPTIDRATFLPIGRTEAGAMTAAVPQAALDVAKSALLPAHVMQGGSYTPEDVTKMALDLAPGRASVADRPTRGQFMRDAPTREEIKTRSKDLLREVESKNVQIEPDLAEDFVRGARQQMEAEGVRSTIVNPKAVGTLRQWEEDVAAGNPWDLQDLLNKRKEASNVAGTLTDPSEARAGTALIDALDDFVEGLTPDQLGGGEDVAEMLKGYRSLWRRQAKAQTIEEAIAKGQRAASGVENGLRNEFRNLLNNKKRIRGFTMEERKAIEDVATGDPIQATLRLLSHLGAPQQGANRFLGMTAGLSIPTGLGMGAGMDPTTAGMLGMGTVAGGTAAGAMAAARRQAMADYAQAVPLQDAPGIMGTPQRAIRRSAGPAVSSLMDDETQGGLMSPMTPEDVRMNRMEQNVTDFLLERFLPMMRNR